MSLCPNVCAHLYVTVCPNVCISVCHCVLMCVHICMSLCPDVCIFVCPNLCAYLYITVLMCVYIGSSRPTSPPHTAHITVTQLSNNVTTLIILLNTHKLYAEKRLHVKDEIFRHKRTETATNRFVISLFKIFHISLLYMFRCR